MQYVMNLGKIDFAWEMLWYIGINVYIINSCIVPCFKEMYLSFPNVAGMDLALMHSYVSRCPCGISGKLSIGKNEVKSIHFWKFRRNYRNSQGYTKQKLPKMS